jgi:uncharacterized protein
MTIIGAGAGVLSGLLGVGGGFIMIPLLTAIGFLMRQAAGMSLLYVAAAAASGTLRHLRQGTVDPILGIILIAGATPASPIGSYFATTLPNEVLQLIYATVVSGVTIAYLKWGHAAEGSREMEKDILSRRGKHIIYRRLTLSGEVVDFKIHLGVGLIIGACVGFVSGLLGVGGGWLLVPLLVLLMRIPLPIAIGTSLFGIMVPAAVGAATHWHLGNLDLPASLPLVIPGVLGAQVGARLVTRVSRARLNLLLNVLLITASLYMLARGLKAI